MMEYLTFEIDLENPETVSVYDELPFWFVMFGLVLLSFIKLEPNQKILDIGCGTGFPLLELVQRLDSTCKVYEIDPWGTAIERLKLKTRILNI
jgi:tRNA1(Val) A37 N6-methylase TrmN6